MGWKWSRQPASGPSYIKAICPDCGYVVRREGALPRVIWWFFFGLGHHACEKDEKTPCDKSRSHDLYPGRHCDHWLNDSGHCCDCGDEEGPGGHEEDVRTGVIEAGSSQ